MTPKTRAAEDASKLDPTALEQSGLDPQQVWKQTDTAQRDIETVNRDAFQTQSAPSSSPATTTSSSSSSSFDYRLTDDATRQQFSSSTQDSPSYRPAEATPPPPAPSLPDTSASSSAGGSSKRRPEPWVLDPTYLEQTGLDPEYVKKEIDAAVRQTASQEPTTGLLDSSKPLNASVPNQPSPSDGGSPSILDILLKNVLPNIPNLLSAEPSPTGNVGVIPPDYLLDQRNPVNIVNRLSDAYAHLRSQLEQTVSKYSDVLQHSGDAITMSPQLQNMVDRYNKALDELKNLPDVEKALRDRFGSYVSVSDGVVGLAPSLKLLVDRANEFALLYSGIQQNYSSALFDLVKRYGLKIEGNTLVVPPDKYDQVKAELEALNKKMEGDLAKLYDQYRDVANKRVVDGKVVYELKPEVHAAAVLQVQVAQTVKELAAAHQEALQNVVDKYKDVLSYDKATGKITPSKELVEMIGRYEQAVQEVNKLTSAMSTVAGMIPAFAQQLPTLKVQFMTYDADKKSFNLGSETPIYIKDPEKRKELLDWLNRQGVDKQNNPNVDVMGFVDPRYNLPVVYIYNKETGEGYLINYMADQVQYLPDAKKYAEAHVQSVWLSSLSPKELEQYIQSQQLEHLKQVSEREFGKLPPVVREIIGTLVTAGQYVFVPDVLVLKGALLGDKDPLLEANKFKAVVEGINETSPVTTYAGTALGIGTIVGGAAASILARGAAKLAARGARTAAEDISKFAVMKKPELPIPSPIQPIQQTAKAPTLLQTAVAGLRNAAVPMAVSGAAFGGLEGVKSHLETGRVDVSRILEGAAFGSLMGAFPITRTQALAALGVGAGATAGAGLLRGYDLPTSLAVGEAAGLTVIVGGGVKGLSSEANAKTPGAKAPEVKITDFATVVKPEGRPAPRVDLSGVDFAKRLSSAVGNVVADVVSGRITVEEANLRLGAFRDAVPDKALFDKILQIHKTLTEPPRAPTLDFASAAKKAAEVVSEVESGKVPGYRAFVELADLRASVADKARFDDLFGAKLREYGEQYVQWLINGGLDKRLDKPSITLILHRYEGVLGRQFIERYMPDYGVVLAEVEAKLSQLRPVSPREAPGVKLALEDVFARVRALFDDVVEGRKDWFKASEELYKMWRDAPPEVRADFETVLNQLNRLYGEKYGVTLEPWRPPLLERPLHMAELFAADVRSALKAAGEFLSPRHIADWWRSMRIDMLNEALGNIASSFRSGKISLEEAKKALAKLADRYEKLGAEEMAKAIREKLKDDEALKKFLDVALELRRMPKLETTLWAAELRLGRAKDSVTSAVREFVPEPGRYTWRGWRFVEAEDKLADLIRRLKRGEIDVETARRKVSKLIREIEKTRGREIAEGYRKYFEETALRREFYDVVEKFRRGEIGAEEARRMLMEVADKIEKTLGREKADFYRKHAEEVLTGRRTEHAHIEEKPHLPDEKDVEWIRRAEEEERWRRMKLEERGGAESGRGQQLLLLERPAEEGARVKQIQRSRIVATTPLERPIRAASALETRRRPVAETTPRQVLTPEVRRALVQTLELRAKETDTTADLIAPMTVVSGATKLKKPAPLYAFTAREVEKPKVRRRIIPLMPPVLQAETPQYAKPPTYAPKTLVPTPQYEVPTVPTFTVPTTADVLSPPTYTPVTVPKISGVPTVDVPTVPTYEAKPWPQPTPLPPMWWRLLPPSAVADDSGRAYKAQSGKRQILTLA